jgi:hypothetical protein
MRRRSFECCPSRRCPRAPDSSRAPFCPTTARPPQVRAYASSGAAIDRPSSTRRCTPSGRRSRMGKDGSGSRRSVTTRSSGPPPAPAFRLTPLSDGEELMGPDTGHGVTDECGEHRIENLPPGRHVVARIHAHPVPTASRQSSERTRTNSPSSPPTFSATPPTKIPRTVRWSQRLLHGNAAVHVRVRRRWWR